MIDSPQITQTIAVRTAVIRLTIPRAEIAQVMGPAISEVMSVVTAQDIGPAGPVFAYHFRCDPEVFDLEVGVPVRSLVAPSGRVQASELPARLVARTVYHGGYEGLAGAWAELDAWIDQSAHDPAQDFWESYLIGPESSSDPADWRTELIRPLINYSAATS